MCGGGGGGGGVTTYASWRNIENYLLFTMKFDFEISRTDCMLFSGRQITTDYVVFRKTGYH